MPQDPALGNASHYKEFLKGHKEGIPIGRLSEMKQSGSSNTKIQVGKLRLKPHQIVEDAKKDI